MNGPTPSIPSFTIIRGKIIDISAFRHKHPGGSHLLSLAEGRDATILFESYHLQSPKAELVLSTLPELSNINLQERQPKIADLSLPCKSLVEKFPTPGESELYATLCRQVQNLLKKRGKTVRGHIPWSGFFVLIYFIIMLIYYNMSPTLITGALLGIGGAWIGVGLQHTANHGGWSKSPFWNKIWAFTDDIGCGGSSLVWRYHHQISHHLYPNHQLADQDVFSSFPLVRFDISQPLCTYHRWQFLYIHFLFPLLYFSVQMQDWAAFFSGKIYDVRFLGATSNDYFVFLLGKFIHYLFLLIIPLIVHGWAVIFPFLTYALVGSFIISSLFIVSHNLESSKPHYISQEAKKDWAWWQIETASSYGGSIASFFTGGLNYQIEHHLFPSLSHNLYKEISPLIQQECLKRGIRYVYFKTLFHNVWGTISFLYRMGRLPPPKGSKQNGIH